MSRLDDPRSQFNINAGEPLLDDYSVRESEQQPEGRATFFSSVANLSNAILGAGLLALPYGFAAAGWVVTIALLVVAGAASAFTMHLLTLVSREVDGPATFFALAKKALPPRSVGLIDVSVVIMCFGLACSYVIVFSTLFPSAIERIVGHETILKAHPVDLLSRQLWVGVGVLTVAPLAFQESFENLQFTSALGVIFVAYGSAMVLVYWAGLWGAASCGDDDELDCARPKRLHKVELDRGFGPLTALSIVIFAFTAHAQVLGIANELKGYTQRKMDAVATCSIGVCGALYVAVGMAGYATFGADPARDSFLSLVEHGSFGVEAGARLSDAATGPPLRRRYVAGFTLSFLAGTWLVAAVVRDLGVILGLIGATCSTFVAFIIPPLVFVKTHPEPSAKKSAATAVLVSGVLLMPTMVAATFVGA
ncbi:hypothetical protein JL720_3823 [Aureococcus anophagefferens]|nr:hypothetical protein JL720_3823 [Aureococcus anophagefferens]